MTQPQREELMPLVRRSREGDERALEILLTRLHGVVRRFLRRRFGHGAHDPFVEEAAIDALVRVATSIEDCRATDEGQFIRWVLTIARSAAIDLLRSEIRRRIATEAWALAAPRCVSVSPPPTEAEQAEGKEILLALFRAIHDDLNDDLQLLIWLRLVDHATWLEISEELGTTASAAKRRYQRAQGRLRRELVDAINSLGARERRKVLDWLSRCGIGIG